MDRLGHKQGAHIHRQNRKARGEIRRRARRFAAIALIGLTPIVALGWAGCGDDDAGGGGTYVDPGGTFGAEVSVTIVGRGRVQTSLPGVDCPSKCFAKYVFSSATADGAAGGVSLKATPTPGSRFKGWTFETDPVGSRGRGPDSCNPIKRPGAQPAVDTNSTDITMPFGEVAGTAPTGKEAACAAFLKVPTVYKVVATFETDPPPPEGGPDTDGGDAGALDILYQPPTVGATAGEMGITAGNYLYWHYQYGGQSGVALGTSPKSTAPQTAIPVAPLGSQFSVFEVDYYGVVFQRIDGSVGAIRYGNSAVTAIPVGAPSCTALAMDSSSNVYCRTSAGIVMWPFNGSSYNAMTTLYSSGIPSGNDLLVESSSGPIYYTTGTSIESVPTSPLSGADGGVASPTPILTGRQNPRNLEPGYGFFWIEGNSVTDTVWATTSKGSTIAYDTTVPATAGFKYFAPYGGSTSTSSYWVANSSSIYRAYYTGGSQTTLFRSGVPGIQGLAADSSYIYWSQSDGRIRRASTF